MTNAISSISAVQTVVRRKEKSPRPSTVTSDEADAGESSKEESAPAQKESEAESQSSDIVSSGAGASQRVAIARHRTLNTAALVIAMGSVCIPIYTMQRRGVRHLPVWIAKAEAVAIGLHLLQVYTIQYIHRYFC